MKQRTQGINLNTFGHLEFEHHDGDNDGQYTIAKGFKSVFIHKVNGLGLLKFCVFCACGGFA